MQQPDTSNNTLSITHTDSALDGKSRTFYISRPKSAIAKSHIAEQCFVVEYKRRDGDGNTVGIKTKVWAYIVDVSLVAVDLYSVRVNCVVDTQPAIHMQFHNYAVADSNMAARETIRKAIRCDDYLGARRVFSVGVSVGSSATVMLPTSFMLRGPIDHEVRYILKKILRGRFADYVVSIRYAT
jgi:hypothetical protein